ncbi:hypothetical protein HOK021_34010 [Streptomyces hygroscopicus]|nr:hypothetical protein HOK021_34010 [Streptomyces hygroscopicus]
MVTWAGVGFDSGAFVIWAPCCHRGEVGHGGRFVRASGALASGPASRQVCTTPTVALIAWVVLIGFILFHGARPLTAGGSPDSRISGSWPSPGPGSVPAEGGDGPLGCGVAVGWRAP